MTIGHMILQDTFLTEYLLKQQILVLLPLCKVSQGGHTAISALEKKKPTLSFFVHTKMVNVVGYLEIISRYDIQSFTYTSLDLMIS